MIPSLFLKQVQDSGSRHAKVGLLFFFAVLGLRAQLRFFSTLSFNEDESVLQDLKSLAMVNCSTVQDCSAALQENAKLQKEKEKADEYVLKYVKSLAVQRSKIPHDVLFPIENVTTIHVLEPRTKPHGTPMASWRNTLFPDFYIAGMPKAGTSHLHEILESHRDVRNLFNRKEVCSNMQVDYIAKSNFSNDEKLKVQKKLYDFHFTIYESLKKIKQLYDFHPSSKKYYFKPLKYKTVGTCYSAKDIILRHDYLMPTKKPRILVLLRDPADWVWASYNFWVRSNIMDSRTNVPNSWTNSKYEYRSPEHFHEIIAAGKRSSIGTFLLSWARMTVQSPRYLKAAFGKDSLFVVRSEDMKPQSNLIDDKEQQRGLLSFFDKLVNFTGLSRGGFQNNTVNSIHNCNDEKGKIKICSAKTTKIGYSISGNREMLSKTRKFIYLYFYEECKIWKEEFDVEYPECLNVM